MNIPDDAQKVEGTNSVPRSTRFLDGQPTCLTYSWPFLPASCREFDTIVPDAMGRNEPRICGIPRSGKEDMQGLSTPLRDPVRYGIWAAEGICVRLHNIVPERTIASACTLDVYTSFVH